MTGSGAAAAADPRRRVLNGANHSFPNCDYGHAQSGRLRHEDYSETYGRASSHAAAERNDQKHQGDPVMLDYDMETQAQALERERLIALLQRQVLATRCERRTAALQPLAASTRR